MSAVRLHLPVNWSEIDEIRCYEKNGCRYAVIAFPDDEHSRQVIAEAKRDLAYFDGSGDFVYSAVEDLAVSLRSLLALIELDGEEKK